MLNTFDDLGDDIYSDGDDDSVYGGTIQTIRNMPYSHDYVPQVNVESYKPLPRDDSIIRKDDCNEGRF
jgi:hypothetical protein